jgi:hypothetical protein
VLFFTVVTPIAVVFNNKEYHQQFFLDRNGRSTVAYVDDLEKEEIGCGRTTCTSYRVFYHFTPVGSAQSVNGTALVSQAPGQSTQVRYDSTEPGDHRITEQHVSLVDVWIVPLVSFMMGCLVAIPIWNTWRKLRRDMIRSRKS